MQRVLIDTDVILDFFFDRKPFSDHAARVLSLCESKEIIAYVTSVIISNVYYILRQNARHDKVIEKLRVLVSITEILNCDKTVISKALDSKFTDFEDAIQNYSAELSGKVDVILTRNIKDFKNGALSVMTPENYLSIYFVK